MIIEQVGSDGDTTVVSNDDGELYVLSLLKKTLLHQIKSTVEDTYLSVYDAIITPDNQRILVSTEAKLEGFDRTASTVGIFNLQTGQLRHSYFTLTMTLVLSFNPLTAKLFKMNE